MRYTNLFAISALTVVLGGGQSLLAADGFFGRGGHIEIRYDSRDQGRYENSDLRRDYPNDYRRVEELRADISRDRARLDCHIREGREYQAADDARDLARDQRMLNELMAHIERDRNAQYRDNRDYRNDNRNRDYRSNDNRDYRYNDRDRQFNGQVGNGYRR